MSRILSSLEFRLPPISKRKKMGIKKDKIFLKRVRKLKDLKEEWIIVIEGSGFKDVDLYRLEVFSRNNKMKILGIKDRQIKSDKEIQIVLRVHVKCNIKIKSSFEVAD